MKSILSLLSLIFTVGFAKTNGKELPSEVTCKTKEFLCGDICVSHFHQCQCGRHFTSLMANKRCCNTQPCIEKINDNYKFVQCPDGQLQNGFELCNGVCRTTFDNFRTIFSQDRQKCVKDQPDTGFCKGQQISDIVEIDQEFCSQLPINDYCIEGQEFQCPQVPGSRYQNRECAKESITTVFHCLNRMHQVDVLFSANPQKRENQEINLNKLLDYNNDSFQCTTTRTNHSIAWNIKDLREVVNINDDFCLLDAFTKIQLRDLYRKIYDDFSFKRRDLAELMGKWSR